MATPYDPPKSPGVILEHRVESKPRASPGAAQKPKPNNIPLIDCILELGRERDRGRGMDARSVLVVRGG